MNWVMWTLFQAEEVGVNQSNAGGIFETVTKDVTFGPSPQVLDLKFGQTIKKIDQPDDTFNYEVVERFPNLIPDNPDWPRDVIRAVGNYQEIFDYNLNHAAYYNNFATKDRGDNNLWNHQVTKGLLYPPAYR